MCHNDSPEWKGLQHRSPGNRFLCRKLGRQEAEKKGREVIRTFTWTFTKYSALILPNSVLIIHSEGHKISLSWEMQVTSNDWITVFSSHWRYTNVCYCSVVYYCKVNQLLVCFVIRISKRMLSLVEICCLPLLL